MNVEALSDTAAALPGATEEQPFGPSVDVFKVAGRIFAILSPDSTPPAISLKCDPERALELRQRYSSVVPGYHLNKRHWNTVSLDGSVPDVEVRELMRHSYDQVVAGLPQRLRDELA